MRPLAVQGNEVVAPVIGAHKGRKLGKEVRPGRTDKGPLTVFRGKVDAREIKVIPGSCAAQGAACAQQVFGQGIGKGDAALIVDKAEAHRHAAHNGAEHVPGEFAHAVQGGIEEQALGFPDSHHGEPQGLAVVGAHVSRDVETAPEAAQRGEDGRCRTGPGVMADAEMLHPADLPGHLRVQGQGNGIGAHAALGPHGARPEAQAVGLLQYLFVADGAQQPSLRIRDGHEQIPVAYGRVDRALHLVAEILEQGRLFLDLRQGHKGRAIGHHGIHALIEAALPGGQDGRVGQGRPVPVPVGEETTPVFYGQVHAPARHGCGNRGALQHALFLFVVHDGPYVAIVLQFVHDDHSCQENIS